VVLAVQKNGHSVVGDLHDTSAPELVAGRDQALTDDGDTISPRYEDQADGPDLALDLDEAPGVRLELPGSARGRGEPCPERLVRQLIELGDATRQIVDRWARVAHAQMDRRGAEERTSAARMLQIDEES
jgi:hypothetical protein